MLTGILGELVLVRLDVADAEMTHVVEGCTQSDGVGHVGCTSLKACRRHVVLRAFDGHIFDHVATTLPGLHLVKQILATIHHTDAVGAVDLMTGEDEEVGSQLLHIHRCVSNRLCSVNQHGDVVRVGDVDDTLHIVDGAERVVHMTHRDKAGAGRDDALELGENQVAVLVRGDGLQRSPFLVNHLLPRHDVGVMVEL